MPYKDIQTQREYQRLWMQKRRAQWLQENGPCANCGDNERLEVDHITRNEKVDHKVWSWSEEKRYAELSKCQILCYACHKAKTRAEAFVHHLHGTIQRYWNGCHCMACRKASANYERNRRAVKRMLDKATAV